MLQPMRLLVVDDDVSVGKLLRAIFEREGWEVDYVSSGEECITAVGATPPDVIVLDHMMPELTGIETARILRCGGYTKPIVFFSAYHGPELEGSARDLDLMPVSKIDTQTFIRIIDVLGSMPHLRAACSRKEKRSEDNFMRRTVSTFINSRTASAFRLP